MSLTWGGLLCTSGQEMKFWDLLWLVQLQGEQDTDPGACPSPQAVPRQGHAHRLCTNQVIPKYVFASLFFSSWHASSSLTFPHAELLQE